MTSKAADVEKEGNEDMMASEVNRAEMNLNANGNAFGRDATMSYKFLGRSYKKPRNIKATPASTQGSTQYTSTEGESESIEFTAKTYVSAYVSTLETATNADNQNRATPTKPKAKAPARTPHIEPASTTPMPTQAPTVAEPKKEPNNGLTAPTSTTPMPTSTAPMPTSTAPMPTSTSLMPTSTTLMPKMAVSVQRPSHSKVYAIDQMPTSEATELIHLNHLLQDDEFSLLASNRPKAVFGLATFVVVVIAVVAGILFGTSVGKVSCRCAS